MKILIMFLVFFASASPSQARKMGDIARACAFERDSSYLSSYVTGVVDYVVGAMDLGSIKKSDGAALCITHGVEVPQIVGVVCRYAREHPEYAGENASIYVTSALQERFPCNEFNKNSVYEFEQQLNKDKLYKLK